MAQERGRLFPRLRGNRGGGLLNRDRGQSAPEPGLPSALRPEENKIGFQIFRFSTGVKGAVWYPTTSQESTFTYANEMNTSVAQNGAVAAGRFPLVIFSHGFGGCSTQSVYFTEALARRGYIVAAPDHRDAQCHVDQPRQRFAFHRAEEPFRRPQEWNQNTYTDRRNDMEAAISDMTRSSVFGPHIDTNHIGASGHSLGGYTVLGLAGAWSTWRDSRIQAALLFSPYSTPYLENGRISQVRIPVMYQGGTRDRGITPGVAKSGGLYDSTRAPKYFVDIESAGHLDWTNRICQGSASISACSQSNGFAEIINAYGVSFLDRYLKQQNPALLSKKAGGLAEYKYDAR